ncbi:LPS assembly protein LptD [Amylibacter sp.]|nr:LPS assembly protein LptD [Amylibacter sp.]
MTKKNLPLFKYILISILLIISNPMLGQETPLRLISDTISYDKISENLSATGNVKVIYEKTTLSAEKISYDKKNDKLSIIGNFTINDGENIIISDNDAIINTKLRNGLIKGARAIINEKLQISAQSLNQKDVNYNIFNTVVASTCEICASNPTPFWQIRARKIIHDKEKQKIFFENARLDFLGLPILYIPALNIPEPGIERASGVLVPQFSTSDKVGFSAKLPYYIVLDNNKDLTFTPYVMSKNSIILETEYRQYTKNGFFELSNAFSIKDNFNKGRINGFIEGDGTFALRKNYKLDFNIDLANTIDFKNGEKPFKNNYDYAEPEDDRLKNTFNISKTTSDSFFRLGTSYTQSFRYKDFDGDGLKEEDPNVPVILPEVYFKKNFKNNIFGGNYALSAHSINLENASNGKYSRIGGKLDWKRSWKTPSGFNFETLTQFNANTYLTGNNFYKNAMPLGMIEARYPLEKSSLKISHMFEPIAQVIFAPDRLTGYLNNNQNTSDSTTAEFEETNLFSTNRFPGFDEIESGSRANIGGKYILYEPNGWEFTTTAGRVFRQKNLKQFDSSKSTGLDKLNSDYVSAFSLSSPQNFKILTRLLLDGKMDASKHETKLNYSTDQYTANIGYVWLDKQNILNLDNHQHEVNISTDYMINKNWKFGADWRQNINTHSPISGNFNIMFENDCAKMNFSLDLKYDEQDRIDRTFGMQIFLSGLGSDKNKKKFSNRCRS